MTWYDLKICGYIFVGTLWYFITLKATADIITTALYKQIILPALALFRLDLDIKKPTDISEHRKGS